MQGSVDNITFYKGPDGAYRIRRRNALSRHRILNAPEFARTREHLSEFATAIRAGKLIGTALAPISRIVHDYSMRNRLTSKLFAVIKSDTVNGRGRRNLMDGDLGLLQDFDLGNRGLMPAILKAHWATQIDRVGGKALVALPALIPDRDLARVSSATHFQIHSAVLEADFHTGFWQFDHAESSMLPVGKWATPQQKLAAAFTPGSARCLLLLLGIEWHLYTNGLFYPLKNREGNGLRIIGVSQANELRQLQPQSLLVTQPAPGLKQVCAPSRFLLQRFQQCQ